MTQDRDLEQGYTPEGDEELQQLTVMVEALAVYTEREKVRGGLWKDFEMSEDVRNCRSKLARTQHACQHLETSMEDNAPIRAAMRDDLIDLINYAVFAVRKLDGKV